MKEARAKTGRMEGAASSHVNKVSCPAMEPMTLQTSVFPEQKRPFEYSNVPKELEISFLCDHDKKHS